MAKHTPGPWSASVDGSRVRTNHSDRDEPSKIVAVCNALGLDDKELCGNADLIAAAPEMFTALHDVNTWAHSLPLGNNPEDGVDEIDILERVEYFVEEIWPIVDAALAKADREYVA